MAWKKKTDDVNTEEVKETAAKIVKEAVADDVKISTDTKEETVKEEETPAEEPEKVKTVEKPKPVTTSRKKAEKETKEEPVKEDPKLFSFKNADVALIEKIRTYIKLADKVASPDRLVRTLAVIAGTVIKKPTSENVGAALKFFKDYDRTYMSETAALRKLEVLTQVQRYKLEIFYSVFKNRKIGSKNVDMGRLRKALGNELVTELIKRLK